MAQLRNTLTKVADELEETARLSAALSDSIIGAMQVLATPAAHSESAHREAVRRIVMALQTEDRVAQRCRHLSEVLQQVARLPRDAPAPLHEAVWRALPMDELSAPASTQNRNAELF